MDTTQNYYQLLHVLPDAPAPVIKASYRAMMQKLRHHPDLGGDPSLAQLLNLAADTLCDPARRAEYDRQLHEKVRQETAKAEAAQAAARARQASENAGGTPRPQAGDRPGSDTAQGNGDKAKSDAPGEATADRDHGSRENEDGQAGARQGSYRCDPAPRAHTTLPARPQCLFCGATQANTASRRQPYGAGKYCLRCAAPSLPIAELPSSLSDELRRMYRHDIQDSVTLWPHWPKENAVSGSLQDLSLVGCAVGCDRELAGNSMVLLETSLLTAICQVRYCKPGSGSNDYQLGLQFHTLDIKAQPGTVFSTVA